MAKKNFKNPKVITERKGLDVLIGEDNTPVHEKNKDQYGVQNLRIRKDLIMKLNLMKAIREITLTELINFILDDYFTKNEIKL